MALKKQVEIKIEGQYIKGKIINDKFISNQLVITKANEFNSFYIEKVILELQELHNTLEGCRIGEKLTEEDTNLIF